MMSEGVTSMEIKSGYGLEEEGERKQVRGERSGAVRSGASGAKRSGAVRSEAKRVKRSETSQPTRANRHEPTETSQPKRARTELEPLRALEERASAPNRASRPLPTAAKERASAPVSCPNTDTNSRVREDQRATRDRSRQPRAPTTSFSRARFALPPDSSTRSSSRRRCSARSSGSR
jgi:hypothetical protein